MIILKITRFKKILDDEGYASAAGKSKYEFTLQLCKLISEYPETIVYRLALNLNWLFV